MQVRIMIWFQSIFENFTDFFDVIFGFFTFFGEELALFIFLPIMYWVINKEIAQLVAFSSFLSLATNGAIKDIVKVERPISNSDIRFVEIENFFVNTVSLAKGSYSFPSGHSQSISVVMFSLSCYYKNKKLWIYSILLVLLVMLSRMYLGVHWPLDVIVGGLLGLIFAYFCYVIFMRLSENKRIILYFAFSFLSLLALFVAVKSDTFKAIGAIMGFAFGSLFEKKFVSFNPKEGTLIKKILRVVIGLVVVGGLKFGLKPLFLLISDSYIFDFIRYFIVVFVAIGLYPFVFKRVRL